MPNLQNYDAFNFHNINVPRIGEKTASVEDNVNRFSLEFNTRAIFHTKYYVVQTIFKTIRVYPIRTSLVFDWSKKVRSWNGL